MYTCFAFVINLVNNMYKWREIWI